MHAEHQKAAYEQSFVSQRVEQAAEPALPAIVLGQKAVESVGDPGGGEQNQGPAEFVDREQIDHRNHGDQPNHADDVGDITGLQETHGTDAYGTH